MGADAAPVRPLRFVKVQVRKIKILPPLITLLAAGCLFVAAGQDQDYYRRVLSSDNREAKRTLLLDIRNLHDPDLARLAVKALNDKDEMVRAMAAAAVASMPGGEAVIALTPLLNDRSAFVRTETAYALGRVGDPSAVTALSARTRDDRAVEVRSAAAVSLGKIGDAAGVAALVSVLEMAPREDTEFLRRSAALSLGQIAAKSRAGGASRTVTAAVTVLVKTLNNSREASDTRREAAFALGQIGDPSAGPALTANLRSSDPYLVEECQKALSLISH